MKNIEFKLGGESLLDNWVVRLNDTTNILEIKNNFGEVSSTKLTDEQKKDLLKND